MSLLARACTETVTVYPEVLVTDSDGNPKTKPSDTGIVTTARLQVQGQSGTSSRRQEQDNEGFESEKVYNLRLHPSWPHGPLGNQAQIEWLGVRWAIFGAENRYNGSARTRHLDYTIKRY